MQMQTHKPLLFALLLSASALSQAHYHGISHAKPLTYDQLPRRVPALFQTRRCVFCQSQPNGSYAAREVVKFLVQALPAATPLQRVEMCKVAERDFPRGERVEVRINTAHAKKAA